MLKTIGEYRKSFLLHLCAIRYYWLLEGVCHSAPPCCCQQSEVNCLEPSQRYYHIPSDWLMPKNNLITVFDDLGAPSPGSLGFVQRVVTA